jgi:hypothetical protein
MVVGTVAAALEIALVTVSLTPVVELVAGLKEEAFASLRSLFPAGFEWKVETGPTGAAALWLCCGVKVSGEGER